MELLFLLRFGTFPVEEKTICGARFGQRWMEWLAFLLFKGNPKTRNPESGITVQYRE